MQEESSLYVKHDEESILLESPNWAEDKAPNLSQLEAADLKDEEKIVVQAYINLLFKSLPEKEESTYEVIRPYINVCVSKQTNWLTYSKALLYRSRNEVTRFKMMERSLSQVQALID